MNSVFSGTCTAMVTAFNENGINFDSMEKSIENQISNKTDCLLFCGTTGEPSTMSYTERDDLLKFAVKTINKRVPIMVGTGTNWTEKAIEMSKNAQDLGADCLLVVTPYYNKANPSGLIKHFEMIAKSVDLPIIVYNVPSRTGVNMSPQVLDKIADIDNIVGMKEASGNISQVADMARLCNDRLSMYSGNDDMVVPLLSLGGKGVISVATNIVPATVNDMVKSYLSGNTKKACDIQLKLLPLINALFYEVNPIPVKTAMNLMGFNMGNLRMPLYEMAPQSLELLKTELKNLDLI